MVLYNKIVCYVAVNLLLAMALGDLQVKLEKALWLTFSGWSCFLVNGPKLALGQ